jgi:hypothetical protein
LNERWAEAAFAMQLEEEYYEEESRQEAASGRQPLGDIRIPADLLPRERRDKPKEAAPGVSVRPAGPAQKRPLEDVPLSALRPTLGGSDEEFEAAGATEQEIQERLREQQDRHYLMSLLREQESLARMEEMRERGELDEFVSQLEHEKRLKVALRQEELDRLWAQIRERREEEERQRRVQEYGALKDAELLRLEIEKLRGQIAERRERRLALEKYQRTAENLQATAAQEGSQVRRAEAEERAEADRAFGDAERLLMKRLEERMENLVSTLERTAERAPAQTSVSVSTGLPVVNAPPPGLDFEPVSVILAGKGLHRLDALGRRQEVASAEPFARAYASSTRSVATARRPGESWRLYAGHKRGVAEIDLHTSAVVGNYPLDGPESQNAVNAARPLSNGGLLATHSRLGLLRWSAPGRSAETVSADISSARCLTVAPYAGGFVFAGGEGILAVDPTGRSIRWLADAADREVTSLAVADRYVFVGDEQGEISWVAIDEPGRLATPFMVGLKVHCLAPVDWKGRTWLACGVRKKASAEVILRDLSGNSADARLSVPERILCLAPLGPGQLAAASERFINFWDLNDTRRARVVPVLNAAPVQDIAPSPD